MPTESDPLGFAVDAKTGSITGTPQRVRDGHKMRLRAVDAAEMRTDVAVWSFSVKEAPTFSLNPSTGWTAQTNGKLASKHHMAETHLLSKPSLGKAELLQYPAGDDFGQVVYLLSVDAVESDVNCATTDEDGARVISALTDVATGEGAIDIKCTGSYSAKLVVRDGAGTEVTVRS